jgi:transposase-like protein
MINWELPHEKPACPHCGSTETQLTLQLLGLIRYSCDSCRKSFAIHGDKPRAETRPTSPDPAARQA